MRRETPRRSTDFPWWIRPVPLLLAINVPLLGYAATRRAEEYSELWQTSRYVDATTILTCLVCLGALAGGIALGSRGRRRYGPIHVGHVDQLVTWRNWTYRVSVLAYVIWLGIGLSRGLGPGSIVAVLSGDSGAVYELKQVTLAPVSGITTWSQLAVVSVAINRVLAMRGNSCPGQVRIIFAITVTRTILFSERLALIEVALGWFVPLLLASGQGPRAVGSRPRGRWMRRIGIVVIPTSAFAAFAVFEYFRSWKNFYAAHISVPYLEFALDRILGYYATAVNNGAAVLASLEHQFTLERSMEFLYQVPLLSDVLPRSAAFGEEWEQFLGWAANPEFNNPGGLLVPVMDGGVVFAVVYWLTIGTIVGITYIAARRGEERGVVVYALLVVGLLEVVRLDYFGDGRAFPIWIAAAALWVAWRPPMEAPVSPTRPWGVPRLR